MKKFFLLIFFFFFLSNISFAQDTLYIKKIHVGKLSQHPRNTIFFPKFRGTQIAKKINRSLIEFLNSKGVDLHKNSIRGALNALRYSREKNKSGLISSSYFVFHSNNTISLLIHFETFGANLAVSNDYLTFSTLNGNRLTLDSLITSPNQEKFNNLLRLKKEHYLSHYKFKMQEKLAASFIDSMIYKNAIHYTEQYCFDNLDLSNFKIDQYKIVLNVRCGSIMENNSPFKNIEFNKYIIKELLREEFVKKRSER